MKAILLQNRVRVAVNRLQTIVKGNHHRAGRQIDFITQIAFQLIHRQRSVAPVAEPGHLVAEGAYRSRGRGVAKTGVLFIAQNVMVGQHRDTAIFLSIQAADPRQPVTNTNLKPGLVETVFQLADNGIAQIIRQGAKRRATDGRRIVHRRIFPGEQILVAQRFMQIAEIVFNPLLALHRFEVAFIDKAGAETEAEFIIIGGRRHHGDNLPGPNVPHAHHVISDLRPDNRIFRGLHIAGGGTLLAKQAG